MNEPRRAHGGRGGVWWAGLAPVELSVECGGQQHRLRWAGGTLLLPDHGDAEGERALAALGGEPSECVALLDAWSRHADDLDVLELASRGSSDRLIDAGDLPPGSVPRPGPVMPMRYAAAPRVTPQTMRGVPARAPGGAQSFGWFAYAPLSAAGPGPFDSGDEVGALLGLGGGLPDRLVAGVIATWAERIADGDARAAAARPALQAALYGRVLASMRSWLGEPALDVDLVMCPPHSTRAIIRAGSAATPIARGAPAGAVPGGAGLRVAVPFAWLSEVWARGFSTVVGHFCVAAEPDGGGGWRLTAVGQDFGPRRTLTLSIE